MRTREKIIRFSAFNYFVHVIVTKGVVLARKQYDRFFAEKYDGSPALALHSFNPNEPISYVFLPLKGLSGTIAHESWHVVRRMLEYCGCGLDNETVAYHLGYLVNEIHDFIR